MQIFIRMIAGNTVTLEVSSDDTIEDVKNKLEEKLCSPVGAEPKFKYESQDLEYEKTIGYYNIKKKSTFYLVLRLRGC